MVKTLGTGRIPRVAGSGFKIQIGTLTASNITGAGSFATNLRTIRHVTTRVMTTAGTNRMLVPHGSALTGGNYTGYRIMLLGTAGQPGTASALGSVTFSFMAVGE